MCAQATTIKVSRGTLAKLDALKKELGAASYDEVIKTLIREYRRRLIEESFGIDRGKVSPFTEEDRGEDRWNG